MSMFDKALGSEMAINNCNKRLNQANKVIAKYQRQVERLEAELHNSNKNSEIQTLNNEIDRLKDKTNNLIVSRKTYIDKCDNLQLELAQEKKMKLNELKKLENKYIQAINSKDEFIEFYQDELKTSEKEVERLKQILKANCIEI